MVLLIVLYVLGSSSSSSVAERARIQHAGMNARDLTVQIHMSSEQRVSVLDAVSARRATRTGLEDENVLY